MNRRKAITSIAVGAGAAVAVAPLAFGQASALDMWLSRWEKAKAFTLQVADAMPADSFSFKPEGIDEVRTFAGQMVHISQAEGFYLGNLGKGRAPTAPQGEGKAEVIAYMTASFDWSIGVIKQLTAADMTKSFGGGKGPASAGLDLLLNAFVHTAHTRGYAEMYLRAKGITPPVYAA